EQERTAAVQRADDAGERSLLCSAERRWTRLTAERLACDGGRPLCAAAALQRRDELERERRRRAVVVGDPECEVDERGRQRLRNALDGGSLDAVRRRHADLGHDAAAPRAAE